MILEIAEIRIAPGQQAAFDEAIVRGLMTVASQAKGFRGWKVNKGLAWIFHAPTTVVLEGRCARR
jgi:hypothetical protein